MLLSRYRFLSAVLFVLACFGIRSGAVHAQAADSVVVGLPGDFEKSHFLVVDLTGDDRQEILVADRAGTLSLVDGASYKVVWRGNAGVFLPEYGRTTMDAGIAAADLDLDGKLEVVMALGGVDPIKRDGPGAVVVLNYVGAPDYWRVRPGWPRKAFDELGENSARPDGVPDGFVATPALGDIDGDGDLEIVLGGMDRRLHAWQHDGTYVTGWPIDWNRKMYRDTRSTAALADMDGDGDMEIFVGTNNYVLAGCPNPYLFYGLQGDSSPMPGFPIETAQNIESSPAVGDINGDGYPEIIFGTGDYSEDCGQDPDGHLVHAYDRFGQPLPGWPVRTDGNMMNSPALGDLDGDGLPEVVIHNGTTLYAWHGDGTRVGGFPVSGKFAPRHQTPVLADMDGDGAVEILVSSGGVYEANGARSDTHPYSWTTLVIADQDADGYLESIGIMTDRDGIGDTPGIYRQIEITQLPTRANAEPPWPMFHRSLDRRGVVEFAGSIAGRVVNQKGVGMPDIALRLSSGATTRTDGSGYYRLDDLLPGTYTVTPANGDFVFTPPTRTVTVPPDGASQDFVMAPPTYTVAGSVRYANNTPVANVRVRLSTGATATTNRRGQFAFEGLGKGSYEVTVTAADLRVVPEAQTVRMPGGSSPIFYLLPQPVAKTLSQDAATPLAYVDTQGLTTRLTFPAAGATPAQVSLIPELSADVEGFLATGHTFSIVPSADLAGTATTRYTPNSSPAFQLELQYSVADLRSVLAAERLRLLWLSPDGWVNATTTCETEAAVGHDLRKRTIQTTLCAWGTYSLVGPARFLHLPVLMNSQGLP
jgi:hypothetical protein